MIPLRILYVSRMCPFPEWDGESIRTGSLLRALTRDHEVTLVTRMRDDVEGDALRGEAARFAAVHAVRIPPQPRWAIAGRALSPRWCHRPLRVTAFCFEEIGRTVGSVLDAAAFDGLVIDHTALAHYLPRVPAAFRGLRVLNLHNVDSVLQGRAARLVRPLPARVLVRADAVRMRRFERRTIRRFHCVLSPSAADTAHVQALAPGVAVLDVPNGIAAIPPAGEPRRPGGGARVLFVGTLSYLPNEDGILWFIEKIWPDVRANVPGAILTIAGHRPTGRLKAVLRPGIELFESPSDLAPFYRQAAVAIVPLRAGSGSRHKILEALAHRVPVVSTAIGAEGLDLEPGTHYSCADSPRRFAAAVERAIARPGDGIAQTQRALPLLHARYSWDVIGRTASQQLAALARARAGTSPAIDRACAVPAG